MEQPIRILHILTEMKGGGVDSFLMNTYRHLDRTKVQFDFLLGSRENIYAEELERLGSRVFYVARYTRHPIRNRLQTRSFLQEHPYPVVHVHGNALMHVSPLQEARRAGVPVRIMHSHSTALKYRLLLPLHHFNRRFLHRWCTHAFACSDAAGRWMFRGNYTVIRNAIELDRFTFDPEARAAVRRELAVGDDTLLIGHVGRMLPVKNHAFLLELLKRLLPRRPDTVLALVGSGPLLEQLRTDAETMGLSDHVRFPGIRSDVSRLLCGMDVFTLPSRYEGLGIAAVEAQANGLPTLCSEAVPEEAILTDLASRLPLEDPDLWVERILTAPPRRNDTLPELIRAGYDIRTESLRLQQLYLELADPST